MAKLEILYFSWVRERIGLDGETIDHPGGEMQVIDLIAMLARRGGGYAQAFAEPARLRAALDQKFVSLETSLGSGRELAIFPPVTGG
ncbi:MoaD/ThiS family protein [Rhizorhapis suberifaciens]|uniref:Molybdopterin synthase sulfur carrier subunit n=1 Tax=Rhizorhapis suberifaciens TaxID=13656 RepID=A0A840HS60_9SPHN|nr:MoaD/ThiS family protein [Rhizorhapis suberifaciens]MBB4640753.1 molybdopterin synthase sulfur carrier subunit [Rhizorhapis suberifaciens]